MEKQDNFKAEGYISILNCGVYEIQVSTNGEAARVRLNDGNFTTRSRWQEIKYDNDGGAFVTFHGRKLMLKDFIIINR